MPTPTPARPWWTRGAIITTAAALALTGLMAWDTTFVPTNASTVITADTAVAFAAEAYDDVVAATIVERAVPLAELAEKMLADPDATGAELGRQEGAGKPYSFAVSAIGTVVEGGFGEVGLEVAGMPGELTAGIAVPPLGSSTALRDAGAEVSFGDFVNQTEYQNVAMELNKLAAESVYEAITVDDLIGAEVSVTGALTWSSKTGGTVDHLVIVPVALVMQP